MKFCVKCGVQVTDETTVCPNCQTTLNYSNCFNANPQSAQSANPVHSDASISFLNNDKTIPKTQQASPVITVQPTPLVPVKPQAKNDKNKLLKRVYIILGCTVAVLLLLAICFRESILVPFLGLSSLILIPLFLILAIIFLIIKKQAIKWFVCLSISIVVFLTCLFITPTCHHIWQPATCKTLEICSECGKTRGETLDHNWGVATCTTPKTCKDCGETEGEALGHNWEGGTCTEARVCNRCSLVDKDSIGHNWVEATYEKPKTCAVCGVTEGSPLINYQGTTKYVVEGYESALSYAKANGYEADYAYNDTRERLVKINSAAYMDDTDAAQWAAFQVIPGNIDTMSCSQLQKKAQTAMEFIVPESSDRFSALMRKFKKMSSVSGTITTTEVNIVVKDMDAFVKELGLTDKIVGGVLAILNMYDYSWIDPNAESALQFTKNGFTFHWKAVGDYKLSLN